MWRALACTELMSCSWIQVKTTWVLWKGMLSSRRRDKDGQQRYSGRLWHLNNAHFSPWDSNCWKKVFKSAWKCPSVVFCCCSPSASWQYSSSRLGCHLWLFELLSPFFGLEAVWTFFCLWLQEGLFTQRATTVLHEPSRRLRGEIAADHQTLKPARLTPTTVPRSKSLFSLILTLSLQIPELLPCDWLIRYFLTSSWTALNFDCLSFHFANSFKLPVSLSCNTSSICNNPAPCGGRPSK